MTRTNGRPAQYAESSWAFLNRVHDPFYDAVRGLLEAWFQRYPPQHCSDLRERFRHDDRRSHIAAFWELYLHELHLRLGFQVEVHPTVPGTSNHPDFKMTSGEDSFYLEATIVGDSDEDAAQNHRESSVIDILNEIKCSAFSLSVDWETTGQSLPRPDVLKEKVCDWLASLDWAVERAKLEPFSRDGPPSPVPSTTVRVDGWAIELRAYAQRAPDVGARDRLVSAPPMIGGEIDDITPARAKLKAKARHYGKPDLPFVIAVGTLGDFAEVGDMEQALYGPEVLRVRRSSVSASPQVMRDRDPDGLWQSGRNHRGTRVSVVLSMESPSPYSIVTLQPTAWINPWATKPLGFAYPFSTVIADLAGNRLDRALGSFVAWETFGLAEGWPNVPRLAAWHAELAARHQPSPPCLTRRLRPRPHKSLSLRVPVVASATAGSKCDRPEQPTRRRVFSRHRNRPLPPVRIAWTTLAAGRPSFRQVEATLGWLQRQPLGQQDPSTQPLALRR